MTVTAPARRIKTAIAVNLTAAELATVRRAADQTGEAPAAFTRRAALALAKATLTEEPAR